MKNGNEGVVMGPYLKLSEKYFRQKEGVPEELRRFHAQRGKKKAAYTNARGLFLLFLRIVPYF